MMVMAHKILTVWVRTVPYKIASADATAEKRNPPIFYSTW